MSIHPSIHPSIAVVQVNINRYLSIWQCLTLLWWSTAEQSQQGGGGEGRGGEGVLIQLCGRRYIYALLHTYIHTYIHRRL